jgi:hypothetical protein
MEGGRMSEFTDRRAARLLAEAGYLPEGSAEQLRTLMLGNALCGQELSNEHRLIRLVCPIMDDDPNISWEDFVYRAMDKLSDEQYRLDGVEPPDREKLHAELRKRLFKD